MKKLFSAIVGLFCMSMSVFAVGAARNWAYGSSDLGSANCIQDYIDRIYVGTAGNIVIYNSSGWFSKVPVSGDVTISELGVFSVTGFSSLALAANKIVVGSAAGLASAQTMGGDANINSNGTVTVTNYANIKIAPGKIIVGSQATNAVAWAVSGDGTLNSNAVLTVTNYANIKLMPGTMIVGNASTSAVAVTMSGDVTIDTNGVATAQGVTSNIVVYGEGNTNFNFFVTNGLIKAFTVTGP